MCWSGCSLLFFSLSLALFSLCDVGALQSLEAASSDTVAESKTVQEIPYFLDYKSELLFFFIVWPKVLFFFYDFFLNFWFV